jgi:hypothetical protein
VKSDILKASLATNIANIRHESGGGYSVTKQAPFIFEPIGEAKRYAPATQRNSAAITEVLQEILPLSGLVLEIASGTGEHIVHFAKAFPDLIWQPSDPDPAGLASITARREEASFPNLLLPLELDTSAEWPTTNADCILCINMVHISPWNGTLGLLRGAAKILPKDGPLYLYGPYRQHGVSAAESNEDFDISLKSRNSSWGLRYVEDVVDAAAQYGLKLQSVINMPANNLSMIFRA